MEDFEKELIHEAIGQIKKCAERHDMECMLVLLKLCKYIAGDEFEVRLETSEEEQTE